MDKYKVKISSSAQNDFFEVAERINALPPEEAAQSFNNIIESAKILATSPDSCPYARDSQLRLRGYRVLTINEYLYFFVINNGSVIIRRILYTKRQFDWLM